MSWEGRLEAESIRKEVYRAVDLQHPVYSEGRNICLMAKDRELKNLKVLDLKNIDLYKSFFDDHWKSAKKSYLYKRH